MANDIPANWYPDAHGTIRWWDGTQWTNYVRGSGAGAPAPVEPTPQPGRHVDPETRAEPTGGTALMSNVASTTVTPSIPTTATTPSNHAAPTNHATPTSHAMPTSHATPPDDATPTNQTTPTNHTAPMAPTSAATSATLTPTEAMANRIGATYPGSAPSTVTSRVIYPVNPEADEEEAEEDHSATRRIVLTATAVGLAAFFLGMGMGSRNQTPQALPSAEPTPVVVTDSPELDQRESDLDEREAQLNDREDELDKRQTELDTRKAELDRRALETPTPTATATATAARIGGEESVLVGTDVRSGTYRTNGPADPDYECEYTVSRDSSATDIIDEGHTSGSATVSLRDGEYFDSDDCQDWTRE